MIVVVWDDWLWQLVRIACRRLLANAQQDAGVLIQAVVLVAALRV